MNAISNNCNISKITGHFTAGYIYGNPKIHKPNNPLRPIISQVPTPTYQLAKSLNNIITPYMPNQYSINSTNQFIDLLHSQNGQGIMASLDVESLFTNVPIVDTIDIISDYVYRNPDKLPPQIPETILKALLELCTSKSPFISPTGQIYQQIDGVAMGSPLGPTFANYYMGHLENKIFDSHELKPKIYVRYVDDIFLLVNSVDDIIVLKTIFEENSVLKFTFEININSKIPFLDVLINNSDNSFKTKVFHKPTDYGQCLNYNSNCPDRYKTSVVVNYLQRAYRVSSTWSEFDTETKHIKQLLINNNYPNYLVDREINRFLLKKFSDPTVNQESKTTINIFYNNQMHKNYKQEERIIKSLVHDNIDCKSDHSIKIIFYYKNAKSSNLVIRNGPPPPSNDSEKHNLIYCYKCPSNHDQPKYYVGKTTTTLNQRMSQHKSIQEHMLETHGTRSTKAERLTNTKILTRESNRNKLSIKEALYILHSSPEINKQDDNFSRTLKLIPERKIDLSKSFRYSNHFQTLSSQPNQSPISQTQSSLETTENLIASSSQPSSMTTLSNNTSPMITDIQTIHYVSPNIQNRITAFLSNNRNSNNNDTNNQDRLNNNTPIRRNLRPRRNIINYTQ